MARMDLSEYSSHRLQYRVKGTALKGTVYITNVTEKEILTYYDSQTQDSNAGNVEAINTTEYVPNPDVPTIIGDEESEAPDSSSKSFFDLFTSQKENTNK